MTSGGGRRPAPTASAAARLGLISLLLTLPLLGGALGRAAPADASLRDATSKARAQLIVASLDPMVVMPRARIRATGSVRNNGDFRLTGGEIRMRLSRGRLNSRAELAAAAAGRTSSADGEIVARQRLPNRLRIGEEMPFDLDADLTAGSAERDFGVYVLTIEVVAAARDGFGRVGVVRTFLPWVPVERDFKPGGFAWLWPILGAPTRLADGAFTDDSLMQEMTTSGRLDRLVAAGESLSAQLPLTWVVDPATLDDARAMSDGYTVAGPDGPTDGAGADEVGEWLGRLAQAAAGQRVISLPYADPDVMALHRNGLLDDLQAARTRGADVTAGALAVEPVTYVAWPAEGFVDRAAASALRGSGFTSLILDARALPPELPLTYTPTGRADIRTPDGTSSAMLYDPVLSRSLGGREDGQPLLEVQRFLAETAMITAELPSQGTDRKVLVAPYRSWSPTGELLDRLVDVVLRAPWIAGVSTEELLAADPPEIDRKALRYPRKARSRELSRPYLAGVAAMNASIDVFSEVLARQPNPLIVRLHESVYRLESTWWRGRPAARANRLDNERRELKALRRQVRVLPGNYTFGSGSGSIPLTISNGLDQEVVVDVHLEPKSLLVEIGDVPQKRIAPRSKIQVNVPTQARAKGLVHVETSLRTPDGSVYDNPVLLRVRVTEYGTVALYITLGAAGVLMLASVARLSRRAIRHRRALIRDHQGPAPSADG